MLRLDINKALAKKLEDTLNNAPQKLEWTLAVAFTDIALKMHGDAGTNAPYKTGDLRRSLNWKADAMEARVGSNLEYARIHDLGGMAGRNRRVRIPKYKGRGYLTPAFNVMKNGEAIKIIENHLKKVFL